MAERPLTSAFIQSARRSLVWESGHALTSHADAARHRPTPPCSSKQAKIIILFAAEHACGCEGEAFCARRILWRRANRLAWLHTGAGRFVLHSRVYPLRVLGPFLDHGKLPLVPSAANSQWRATMEMSGSSPLPMPRPCARTLLLRVPGHHASERRPGVAPSSLAPSTRLFRAGTPQDTRRGTEVLCGGVRRHIGVATPGALRATCQRRDPLIRYSAGGTRGCRPCNPASARADSVCSGFSLVKCVRKEVGARESQCRCSAIP